MDKEAARRTPGYLQQMLVPCAKISLNPPEYTTKDTSSGEFKCRSGRMDDGRLPVKRL